MFKARVKLCSPFSLDFTVTDKIVVEVMQKHKLIVAFTTSNNAVWMRISVNCYK